MLEVENQAFTPDRSPFFAQLDDGLHRAENILTVEDAVALHFISVVKEADRTILIARTDLVRNDVKQQIEVVEVNHTGQVKFIEEIIKPKKPNCTQCGEKLKSVKVIADTSAEAVCCGSCGTDNPAKLVRSSPTTRSGSVITDLRGFDIDYEGSASDVLSELKGLGDKVDDLLQKPDSALEKALKPFGDAQIRVWEYTDESDASIEDVCIQIGELRTSGNTSEDLTEESRIDNDSDEESINLPQLTGALKLETEVEGDDFDILVVTGPNNIKLPVYIWYDEDGDPAECIVSSKAIMKGGWSVKATHDASDSGESYFELKTVVNDLELITDDGPWEEDTDFPFGYIKVEYPNDPEEGIPAWAEQLSDAGFEPDKNDLYINIDIPDYDMGNLKFAFKSSKPSKK